jgi:hypothetical protein
MKTHTLLGRKKNIFTMAGPWIFDEIISEKQNAKG